MARDVFCYPTPSRPLSFSPVPDAAAAKKNNPESRQQKEIIILHFHASENIEFSRWFVVQFTTE